MFSVDTFETYWPDLASSFRYFSSVSSTNDTALLFKKEDGAIIAAEEQTAGRGRAGSRWYSEEGNSLTFSLVFHSSLPLGQRSRFSLAAGLAITQVLEQNRLSAEVKWPNDVLIKGKKICGILVEAFEEGAIVGIGINVTQMFNAPEMEREATSIFEEIHQSMDREWLLGAFVNRCYQVFRECEEDFPSVLKALNQRLAWRGETVTYKDRNDIEGLAVIREISTDGSLLVEQDGVVRKLYSAGEIQVVNF